MTGYWSAVYYAAARLMDTAQAAGVPLSGQEAFNMARLAIDEQQTGQQPLTNMEV